MMLTKDSMYTPDSCVLAFSLSLALSLKLFTMNPGGFFWGFRKKKQT